MTLYKTYELLNSDGAIVSLLKSESDSLFIMGNTNNGKKKIITKTNNFQISLFLQSRINLKELYLLNQDSHFIIIDGENTEAVFFEITQDNLPAEIEELECGSELYHFLPSGMRTILKSEDIFNLLPNPLSNERPLAIADKTAVNLAIVDFFNPENSPIRIVTLESDTYNPDEHDYLMCPTRYGKEEILVKINPYILFLFLQNRLSISEVYKCRMNDFYIIREDDNYYRSKYNSYIESLLQNLGQLNQTYYSLAPSIRIETPIELYKYYINNHTISGKGILEPGFKRTYPVDLKIYNK